MAKKKQFMILLGILAVLIVLYMVIDFYKGWQQGKETEAASEQLAVTQIDEDRIQKISYTDKTNTVTLEKKDKVWYNANDEGFPLKQSYAEDVAETFSKITANRKLSNPDELSGYGLESPAYTITLTEKNGNDMVIEIGNVASDSDYYLSVDKGKTVYTVSSLLTESLSFDENEFLQTETFPEIDSSNLQSFTLKQKGKTLVSCSTKEEDDNKLSDYGSDLSLISLDDCVDYKVTKKQLKKYGLIEDVRREISAEYKESDSKKSQKLTFYMGTSFEEEDVDYAYVQLKGSKMVYKVNISGTDF